MTPLPHGGVLVESGPSGFANSIRECAHQLLVDEPVNVGGTDTGPNPYEYLLGALGGCTSMTLRMYADRKGWPLEDISCRNLNHTHQKDDGHARTTRIRNPG